MFKYDNRQKMMQNVDDVNENNCGCMDVVLVDVEVDNRDIHAYTRMKLERIFLSSK